MSDEKGRNRRWTDRLAESSPEGAAGLSLRWGSEAVAARSAANRAEGLRHCLQPRAMRPGHRASILVDGAEAYPAMLDAIAGAQEAIDLETYIWMDDEAGRSFVTALTARAQAGCRVRCLLDDLGTIGTPRSTFAELVAAGGEVAAFHPIGPWRRRWGWSVRDHRKLLIVDGRVAFTGGLNLGDDYAPREWGGRGWHDIHLRIEGPAVADMERLFEDAWRYTSEMPVARLPRMLWRAQRAIGRLARTAVPPPSPEPAGPHALGAAGNAATETPAGAVRSAIELASPAWTGSDGAAGREAEDDPGQALAQVLAIGRRRDRRFIQRHCQFAVAMARRRAWLFASYFIPNRSWRRTLCKAAQRGVDVRVLVPYDSDVPAIYFASCATYQQLLDAGVRIFEYLPTMLHAKAFVVDSAWATIGSYNLDQRSLLFNWELSVALVDGPACARLEQQLLLDLDSSREIDPQTWPRRSPWRKLRERFFHFFRWYL